MRERLLFEVLWILLCDVLCALKVVESEELGNMSHLRSNEPVSGQAVFLL